MNWQNIGRIVYTCVLLIGFVDAISLDANGGYSFVIAVEPSTPEPEDLADFVDKLRATFTTFSRNLHIATEETFFIRTVDFLLPQSWQASSVSTSEGKTESYESADIRLSSSLTAPFVENVSPCGMPGSFIELPFRFLDRSQPQIYGEPSKTLVHLWARYRFGVWEEHGDPMSGSFPYFYRNSTSQEWEPTGCSERKLDGQRTDKAGESCGDDKATYPSSECRFRPDHSSPAETSLMGFYWLESVTKFCKDANHNNIAPNRQNTFCEHKSVWSVIETTPDFKHVTSPRPGVPAVVINILKPRIRPALYVLLDRGSFTGNSEAGVIIVKAIRSLISFFEMESIRETVVNIASFPSEGSNEVVQNLISWSRVGESLEDIYEVLGTVEINKDPGNFAAAVHAVSSDVHKLNPLGGAVLLVIKTGNGQGFFDSNVYEEDLLFSLKKNRVTVFAAEIQSADDSSSGHLSNIATKTAGKHLALKSSSSTEMDLQELFSNVQSILTGTGDVPIDLDALVYRRKITPAVPATVSLTQDVKNVQIHLTLPHTTAVPTITIDGRSVQFTTNPEWDETVDNGRRITRTVSAGQLPEVLPEQLVVQFTCTDCATVNGVLTVTATPTVLGDVVVTLSTSATGNVVDFSQPLSDLAPFAIYAKVEQVNKPVVGVTVTAEVTDATGQTVEVTLLDNGMGTPDVLRGDGIYSAIFIPELNGAYQISAKVSTPGAPISRDLNVGVSGLLPVDQGEIGQRETVELTQRFSAIFDYSEATSFINVDSYTKVEQPVKIFDLAASVSPDDGDIVRLTFTSPSLMNGRGKASKYIVQGARVIQTLVSGSPEIRDVMEISAIGEPGTGELLSISNPAGPHVLTYFQIRAINQNAAGEEFAQTSNIVQVMPANPQISTTTETTTTDSTTTTSTGTGPTTTTTPGVTTSSTTQGSRAEEEDKPFFETAGGIVLIVVIALVAVGAAGGGYWFYRKRQNDTGLINREGV